jgi:hypothetical protein
VGNVVSPEMIKSMNRKPIVFAMANPDPEISYEAATAVRDDIIMATGRSDYPNQVNDWYIFPVSFRTTNKSGEGNYFNGIPLDKQAGDGLNKDWGDRDEASLASILKYINTGSFSVAGEVPGIAARTYKNAQVIDGNGKLDRSFKGAIDSRRF